VKKPDSSNNDAVDTILDQWSLEVGDEMVHDWLSIMTILTVVLGQRQYP
jgi:hypothetical protein